MNKQSWIATLRSALLAFGGVLLAKVLTFTWTLLFYKATRTKAGQFVNTPRTSNLKILDALSVTTISKSFGESCSIDAAWKMTIRTTRSNGFGVAHCRIRYEDQGTSHSSEVSSSDDPGVRSLLS